MTLAGFPELQKLSDRQKAALADALWASAVSDKTLVSASHKKILDARWHGYKAGAITRISRNELKDWIEENHQSAD